jgi:ATP/maltotriose-dependent transcriptional regulator MalT
MSGLQSQAEDFFRQAQDANFLDAFVMTYRACPKVLEFFVTTPVSFPLRRVLNEARDARLARTVGLEIGLADSRFADLTRRETEVLTLLAQGLTNVQIAKKLFITRSTVKVHVHHIFDKLGVQTRLQAVLAANEQVEQETRRP